MKPLDPVTVTLLIDMDAILADILKTWLPLINKDYNENLAVDNITNWNIANCTKTATHDQVMEYLNNPKFFEDLDPIPGAIENLKKLHEEGFDIWIVTAPPYSCDTAFTGKLHWMAKHAPFIPQDRVIFARHKGMIHGDILFDDGPHNLAEFPRTAVAMDYPFNKDYEGPRVKNWDEFYQFAQEYRAKKEEAQCRAEWSIY